MLIFLFVTDPIVLVTFDFQEWNASFDLFFKHCGTKLAGSEIFGGQLIF